MRATMVTGENQGLERSPVISSLSISLTHLLITASVHGLTLYGRRLTGLVSAGRGNVASAVLYLLVITIKLNDTSHINADFCSTVNVKST